MILFGRTQTAFQTPFDPTDSSAASAGFSSDNVQGAIVEARALALNKAVFAIIFSRDGTPSANTWLYYGHATPSNQMPFVTFKDLILTEYTVTTQAASTATLVLRNVQTNANILSIPLASSLLVTGAPNIAISQGIQIGAIVTNASANRPCLTLIFRVA